MRCLAVITLALLVLTGCQTINFAAELKRIRPLAEQGDTKAQTRLGTMYIWGEGVPKDNKEAARWFRKASDQGDANAQRWLGDIYHHGHGITRDYKEAVRWYRKAAKQGNASAYQLNPRPTLS